MNEKTLLQTRGRMREQAPASGKSGGFLSAHQLVDGQLHLSDMDYCVRFGEPKEWAGMRKEVEERRSKIPAWSFWICKKCGWVSQAKGDQGEPLICVKCNLAALVDGGWMRKMDEGEIAAFKKTEAENGKRIAEREAAARLFEVNQGRQKTGLPPFSAEQLAAAHKTDWERKREWEKKEAERQAAWKAKKKTIGERKEIQPKAKP